MDSVDKERLGIAKEELFAMLEEDELKDSVLVVFANKQDMPGMVVASASVVFVCLFICTAAQHTFAQERWTRQRCPRPWV